MSYTQKIYEAVLENLGEALIIISGSGTIEHFTYAAEQLFLYDRSEVLGKDIAMLMPDDIGQSHQHYVNAYSSNDRSTVLGKTRELIAVRKNGVQFPVEITVTKVTVDNRRLFVGLLKDISEKVTTFKELNEAKATAEIANNAKSEFLGNMCHEIRTPMNGILGTLQLLKQRQLDTETSQLVDIALTSSELLMRILNDILDFSKLEASKVIIDEHPFSLSDLVSEVVNNVQGAVANKGLSLTVNFNASASEKRIGDEVRIKQVLGNVVSNAIKFTEKGTIILTVNTSPSTTRFIVQDSGIGMTPEQISSLCDRFSQADLSTTRHYGGTGLGMAIVSELLTLMNGTLKVASEINTGTTITIKLPLKKAYSTILTTNKSYEVSVPDFTGRTLLIAEDNDINRLVVEELLKPTNATLVIVNDGQQLLQYCRDSYADLIITDINMPVMGGEEALKKLQDTGFARPVIALTANAVKQQVEHYLAMGFHDVLSKPVFAETLYFVIDKHLEN